MSTRHHRWRKNLKSPPYLPADRTVAAKHKGYMPLAELQAWLDEAAPQVDPRRNPRSLDSTPPDEEQLLKLVDRSPRCVNRPCDA